MVQVFKAKYYLNSFFLETHWSVNRFMFGEAYCKAETWLRKA